MDETQNEIRERHLGIGLAWGTSLGVAIGAGLGVALGDLAWGVGIGLSRHWHWHRTRCGPRQQARQGGGRVIAYHWSR